MPSASAAYACDITYGTNNEMGFDYLRDNMVIHKRRHGAARRMIYAIVDEVDSILIDEARTPLIISGQGDKSTDLYEKANQFVSPPEDNEEDYTHRREGEGRHPHRAGRRQGASAPSTSKTSPTRTTPSCYHHILAALQAPTPS